MLSLPFVFCFCRVTIVPTPGKPRLTLREVILAGPFPTTPLLLLELQMPLENSLTQGQEESAVKTIFKTQSSPAQYTQLPCED